MNSQNIEASARLEVAALIRRGEALITHGLIGIDLVKCWLRWSIQPLAIRPRIMYEYTGESTDSLRYSEVTLTEDQVMKSTKPLLGEKMDALALHGLPPFFTQNKAPALVTSFSFFEHCHVFFISLQHLITL